MKHSDIVKGIIKKEINDFIKTNQKLTISFDESTSLSNVQMLNIISHCNEHDFNLGLVSMKVSCNAENLLESILTRLDEFGIEIANISYWIADGAAVNRKISRISNIPIMRCINHSIQLAIVDIFYKDVNKSTSDKLISLTYGENPSEDIENELENEIEVDAEFNPQDFLPTENIIEAEMNSDLLIIIKKSSRYCKQV